MSKILVVDFGSQYTHLICKRLKQLGVKTTMFYDRHDRVNGIILSGGPKSVYDRDASKVDSRVIHSGIPVLGICYGHQLIAHMLGGRVKPGKIKEYGRAELTITKGYALFSRMKKRQTVWMSHGDEVIRLPPGFKIMASTGECRIVAFGNPAKKIYGVQFHPEVSHTKNGMQILENFIRICGIKPGAKGLLHKDIEKNIKEKVKDRGVLMLVSGGVESTVAFVLLNRVLGRDNVLGLFVDNGLLRHEDIRYIKEELCKSGNVHIYDAKDLFLERLSGIAEPEHKREIIGNTFLEVKDAALKKLGIDNSWLLGQGTIYPDTIETQGTAHSAKIKTHHNRVCSVKKLVESGKVIEPLSELYKDEVRELGFKLGIPAKILKRHPFPGPGLAVRCICLSKTSTAGKKAIMNVQKIASNYGYASGILPVRTVGVQGDCRTYKFPAVLNGGLNWDVLDKLSTILTNKIAAINRVFFLLSGSLKPEPKIVCVTEKRLEVLREVDSIATSFLHEHNLYHKIWQMPVVLLPLLHNGKESVVLRPVCSREAMTASFAKIDQKKLGVLVNRIVATGKVGSIFYDITNKPPGTIELE